MNPDRELIGWWRGERVLCRFFEEGSKECHGSFYRRRPVGQAAIACDGCQAQARAYVEGLCA